MGQGATCLAGRLVTERAFNRRTSEVILVRKQLTNWLITGQTGCGQGSWGLFHLPSHCLITLLCCTSMSYSFGRKNIRQPCHHLSWGMKISWASQRKVSHRWDELKMFLLSLQNIPEKRRWNELRWNWRKVYSCISPHLSFSSEKWGEIIFVFFALRLTTDSLELGMQPM